MASKRVHDRLRRIVNANAARWSDRLSASQLEIPPYDGPGRNVFRGVISSRNQVAAGVASLSCVVSVGVYVLGGAGGAIARHIRAHRARRVSTSPNDVSVKTLQFRTLADMYLASARLVEMRGRGCIATIGSLKCIAGSACAALTCPQSFLENGIHIRLAGDMVICCIVMRPVDLRRVHPWASFAFPFTGILICWQRIILWHGKPLYYNNPY